MLLLLGPYLNNLMCCVILVARLFVPFDDAKVRRFSETAMLLIILFAHTAPFVDEGQRKGQIWKK